MSLFGIFCFMSTLKKTKSTESARTINAGYGDQAINISQCQQQFQKFRGEIYSLEDEFLREKLIELDEDDLNRLREENPFVIAHKIANKLGIDHPTFYRQMCITLPKFTQLTQTNNILSIFKATLNSPRIYFMDALCYRVLTHMHVNFTSRLFHCSD